MKQVTIVFKAKSLDNILTIFSRFFARNGFQLITISTQDAEDEPKEAAKPAEK